MPSSVKGGGGHLAFLAEMNSDTNIAAALNEAALSIKRRAQANIRSGGKSGRLYPVPGARGAYRQASAPGESPASFTGDLAEKIRVQNAKPGQPHIVAFVGARSRHAHLLEFGTVDMAARPFFGPAIAAARSEYRALVLKGIDKAIKRAARKK